MGQAAKAIVRSTPPRPAAGAWRVSVSETRTADDAHSKGIVAIAQRHDRAAFAALFSHFAPRVKSYLMRTGTSASLAEEVAQETMLTVWRKAEQFDPARASASTWVFTIARNLRIDAARRTRDPASIAAEIEPEAVEEPFAAVARRQSQVMIREALKQLPAEQREVLALSFFEDRPHSEIAATLKIPLGTVKSRVRLAVSKLRELVEGRT
jgi:RNA polymerase sigma-70 factor (ECF subfamily)